MADKLISATAPAQNIQASLWGPYWVSPLVGAMVYVDADGDLVYSRTTDGGDNWSETEITTATTVKVAAWFGRETPGFEDSDLLHIWWIEATDGNLRYRTLDIAADSLGTERTVATLVSGETVLVANTKISGTMTRNGNLLVCGRQNATTDSSWSYRSTTAGVSWGSITDLDENAGDYVLLFPANTADGADAAALFGDISDDELSVKMWDDSAGTWTETSVRTTVTPESAGAGYVWSHIAGSVRHSDGFIVYAIWSEVNSATADLLTGTVNPNSISSPGVTNTANVVTDTAGSGMCSVLINQQNDDVYVAYGLGGTWEAAVDVKFKVSTDDLSSFGTQQDYSEDTADDVRRIHGGRTISGDGGRIQWSFYNDDLEDVFVNLTNDVEVSAVAGGAPVAVVPTRRYYRERTSGLFLPEWLKKGRRLIVPGWTPPLVPVQ